MKNELISVCFSGFIGILAETAGHLKTEPPSPEKGTFSPDEPAPVPQGTPEF